jgi:DNA-binding transcriptional regulator YhcF (GntR family)
LLGVDRPRLSREFSNLVNAGLIEAKGKKVRFINKAGLMKMLQEE